MSALIRFVCGMILALFFVTPIAFAQQPAPIPTVIPMPTAQQSPTQTQTPTPGPQPVPAPGPEASSPTTNPDFGGSFDRVDSSALAPDDSLGSGSPTPGDSGLGSGSPTPGGSSSSGTRGGEILINPLGYSGDEVGLQSFLESLLDFAITIGSIVIVVMMVYIGFMFVTAQGDPDKIRNARKALEWTVLGALLLLGAKVIAEGIRMTVQALSVGG